MLRTCQGGVVSTPSALDDMAAIAKVDVPEENCRNPLWEAKHQRDLLKDYSNSVGALAEQKDRI